MESRTDVPTIRVTRDEVVRFHLEFTPKELTLEVAGMSEPLAAQRVAEWRVRGQGGVAKLSARSKDDFSAQYVARLTVD